MAFLPALAAVGSAVSALGTISSDIYQARVAQRNAQIAKQNAQAASEAGQANAAQQDKASAQLQGEQLAAQSASGLNLMGRSEIGVRRSQSIADRQTAANLFKEGYVSGRNYEQQAAQYQGQAAADKTAVAFDAIGGALNTASLIGKAMPTKKKGMLS